MRTTFRQSMSWLHTWGGLVCGWLLFAIFLTGTLSVFRTEISAWMQPELPSSVGEVVSLDAAHRHLQRHSSPAAQHWHIHLPTERAPWVEAGWHEPFVPGQEFVYDEALLHPATGEELRPRQTRGGDLFYRFHFELMLGDWWLLGRVLVSLAAVGMLVALLTGLVIHRRIFKDFFTFRPRMPPPRSWLDFHNVVGVLALPFHLFITYSGLVMLMWNTMPAGILVGYGGDQQAFFKDLFPPEEIRAVSGTPAEPASLDALLAKAHDIWGPGVHAHEVGVVNPGDRNAVVTIQRERRDSPALLHETLYFDAVTGDLLYRHNTGSPATSTLNVLYGIHVARYADVALRWLYFLCGLAGTAMIGTGLVLWAVKRRPQHAGALARGHRLVEGLNAVAITGVLIAVAAYFWANRLLPQGWAPRDGWEIGVFFGVWALAPLHAFLRPPSRAWREQLWLAAALFAALPLLNALTTGRHLGVSLPGGDWVFAGFDLAALATGAVLAVTALKLSRRLRLPGRDERAPVVTLREVSEP